MKRDLQTIGFSHFFALTGFEVRALHLTLGPSPKFSQARGFAVGEGNEKNKFIIRPVVW